jgi:hypothetical protein
LIPAHQLPIGPINSTDLHLQLVRFPDLSLSTLMSRYANNQTASSSTDNFTAIFSAALNEYQAVTGNRLDAHPFANQLNTCNSPEAVSNVLRDHTLAFSQFRNDDKNLMAWLDPIVHILFAFSGTLGEGIGLVSRLVDALHPMRPTFDIWSSAVFPRKNDLYRNRCSS